MMLRRRNRDMERRVTEIRNAVMDQWDRMSSRDIQRLSDTLDELQGMLETRYTQQQKRWRKELKPLGKAATKTARHLGERGQMIGQQAERISTQAGETVKRRPMVAVLAGALLGLLVMSTIGRRYLG